MKKIIICPFCDQVIKRNMEECPNCRASREIMEREINKRLNNENKEENNNLNNVEEIKVDNKNFSQDVGGKIEIKTDDVTILPKTYSVKTARGEDKPKWWEIYKKVDIILARRKIVREVNKEGRKYPKNIKKWKLVLFALLFGYMGLHNFYAKNTKKGWVHLGLFAFVAVFVNLDWSFLATTGLDWLIGGSIGFACVFMWFSDFINILFNKFVFRISKEEFIKKLNYNTRSKLGKKYCK